MVVRVVEQARSNLLVPFNQFVQMELLELMLVDYVGCLVLFLLGLRSVKIIGGFPFHCT